jgi:hypothetical protein
MTALKRLAALAWGGVALGAAAPLSLLAVFAAAGLAKPNPDPALDGDPCCAHPDTWGDVAATAFFAAASSIVVLGLVGLAAILVWSAVEGGLPPAVRRSRLVRRAGAFVLLWGLALLLTLLTWVE